MRVCALVHYHTIMNKTALFSQRGTALGLYEILMKTYITCI